MDEDYPQRKKRWYQGLTVKRSHLAHPLPDEIGRIMSSKNQPSLHPPSQSGSGRGRSGLLKNLFKSRPTRSTEQSPNPAPMTSHSSVPHQSNEPSQDPSSHTALPSDPNLLNPADAEAELPDPKKRIEDAEKATADLRDLSGMGYVPAITNGLQSGLDAVDTLDSIIKPLKMFNDLANVIAEVHPYAKAVLSIFTYASKIILDQKNRDDAVRDLVKKLSEVYTFMTEDGRLAEIPTIQALYGKLARQTLECAEFIVRYSDTKSAWKRLAKNVGEETDATIQSYNNILDTLMQHFRDGALRDIDIKVHRMAEDMDFKDMIYVNGAGRDTSKCCLPGTRESLLSEIKTWIDSNGEDVERVFWLNGTAGKGKSAIAHTIADWFDERGGPGALFCFDRTQEAEKHHEKIFATIARDLADRDPLVRRELARVVRENNELRHTKDIIRQWKQFILGPVEKASTAVATPILIIIDALDESGKADSREQILSMLAGKQDTVSSELTKLPENLRVLVTSRTLDDIDESLRGALHVRDVSMDHIPAASSESDIHLYITTKLQRLRIFNDGDSKKLAQKSDGLFEWARLACEYIKGTNKVARNPMVRFAAVVAGTSGKGTRLLDDMYRHILEEIMPQDEREEVIIMFCSVMGQILASLEPLPITALTAMREHFPPADEQYEVESVISRLGSLVTGTTDSQTPIRPLHASFYDFLTDKSRSDKFFVDISLAQRDLAFASLGVMKHELRFNVCSLESSFVPNSAIPNLGERVKDRISAGLSYSCRFWGTHVGASPMERLLAKEVEAFFDGERLLFWIEAVSLLKSLGGSVGALSCIARWIAGHAEYTSIADAVRDTQRFIRTFAQAISHSTPHLYLSALPLAPTQSKMFQKFNAKFPCTPRVVGGHVEHWPLMEKIIHVYAITLAISPDGRYVVCGSIDGTIHMRDMDTGEPFGAPFIGHTAHIWSIAISPDGDRIVSGSEDETIRVWDAGTGKALCAPLKGHLSGVRSVAVSPDGNRIVSGSNNGNIRMWDMVTGETLRTLCGHTGGVHSIAISPDGNRIVSGSGDRTIRIWDMDTGKTLDVLRSHTDSVISVAISPDGNYIVSSSYDETIRMWDATTGKELSALPWCTDGKAAISPDGNTIVSVWNDCMIRVWDTQTGEALGAPLQGHTSSVKSVAISPDGNRIVSCSIDRTIRVWDADTRKALSQAPLQGHTDPITSVAISPDGNHIVSHSTYDTILVWDAYTGEAFGAPFQGHSDSNMTWPIVISRDGTLIASSSDNRVRVWDTMTGEPLGAPLQVQTEHDSVWLAAVSYRLDGKHIVSCSPLSAMIHVWDVVTCEAFSVPLDYTQAQDHRHGVWPVDISPDGKYIVSASNNMIRMWDTVTGQTLRPPFQLQTGGANSVAVSPDGKHIVLGGETDGMIWIWNVESGEVVGTPLRGDTKYVKSVAISPNGHHVVIPDGRMIRAWNIETCKALCAPLEGHTGFVECIAISLDSKYIVSGSNDTTIRVWDLEFLIQCQSFEAPVVCFSSNPTHALRSASSFMQDLRTSASHIRTEDGWIISPEGRLLLWIPTSLYPVVYALGNTLVIPDGLQLDLSCLAHGSSWGECREDGRL